MNGEIRTRLPVPVTVFGPLHLLAQRVHRLATTGHGHEALRAADAYLALAQACGDTRTVPFLLQGKMYANLSMGRVQEAADLAGRLLRRHRAAGSALGEAKALCDLAHIDVLRTRDLDAMRNLARAAALLDLPHSDRDRHRSALCSFAEAATAAEMYETAASTYDQLSEATDAFGLVHAVTLLYWGLRLGHVGRHDEGAARLRRSAEITRRHVDERPDDPVAAAMLALALAKLGDIIPAEKLARDAVLPLRDAENYQYARMAHLALGISLRTQGMLSEARMEFLAAASCARSAGARTRSRSSGSRWR
jgi:diguanylate cyclase